MKGWQFMLMVAAILLLFAHYVAGAKPSGIRVEVFKYDISETSAVKVSNYITALEHQGCTIKSVQVLPSPYWIIVYQE